MVNNMKMVSKICMVRMNQGVELSYGTKFNGFVRAGEQNGVRG